MLSFDEALRRVVEAAKPLGSETVPLADAQGRVLAEPICADRDLPPFHRSERDGFAVRAADFVSGFARLSVSDETIHAGDEPGLPPPAGACARIMTGAPLPEGADAVVPVEKSRQNGESVELRYDKVKPFVHVHRRGVDAAGAEELLAAGTLLDPPQLAVAAAVGAAEVTVHGTVRVALLSTGDELIGIEEMPGPSQIRDCNGPGLEAFFAQHPWLSAALSRRIADDEAALAEAIRQSLEISDVLILSGGLSMGDRDFVPGALKRCGVRRRLHKVAIRPGKPFWLGASDNGKMVFGLPGNPVAVQVTFQELVLCALRRMAGLRKCTSFTFQLPAAQRIEKDLPLCQFLLARLVPGEEGTLVAPLPHHGSGDFVSASRADGVMLLPEGPVRLERGDPVRFHLWRRP